MFRAAIFMAVISLASTSLASSDSPENQDEIKVPESFWQYYLIARFCDLQVHKRWQYYVDFYKNNYTDLLIAGKKAAEEQDKLFHDSFGDGYCTKTRGIYDQLENSLEGRQP
jgi:hypothetical protein